MSFRFATFFLSLSLLLLFSPQDVYAATSNYRAAGWVATDGSPAYTTTGCKVSNDGLYCSRPSANGYGNLYFSSFGTLSDFGIPQNVTITALRMRVRGRNTVSQGIGVTSGINQIPFGSNCYFPSDLWPFFL